MSIQRLRDAINALIDKRVSNLPYHALWPSKVIAQRPDGTLDLEPDDKRIKGKNGVPIRLGIPGVTVTVAPGARVLLGFEQGDADRPMATLWEPDGILRITLPDGLLPVARVGDTAGPYPIIGGNPKVLA